MTKCRKVDYYYGMRSRGLHNTKGRTKVISDFFGNTMDSVSDFFGNITDWANENLASGPWPALLAVTFCTIIGIITL